MRAAQTDRIAIGADHGGFQLKQHLKAWLQKRGYAIHDCGTLDGSRCDYPDIAAAVATMVSDGRCARGIIIDGAGIGSSMVANKLPGVRAALCYDLSSARNSREHNNANVLTLGAGLIGSGLAEQIADTWLTTVCSEERHLRRADMIEQVAANCACAPAPTKPRKKSSSRRSSTKSTRRDSADGRWDTRRKFVLAGPAGAADNAAAKKAARKKTKSPTSTKSAFRASSARQLAPGSSGSAASVEASQSMDSLNQLTGNLSPAELERVVARVAQLLSAGQQRGGQWCFGDVCINASLAKQWIDAGVGRLSTNPGNVLGGGSDGIGDVAGYIDHTLLKPNATRDQVKELCEEAREHTFASVCVNAYWVPYAAKLLRGSPVAVCTVVGFPLGASMPEIKAHEARRAIRDGAREIDMVINIGALKSGDDDAVYKDIRAVVDACQDGRAISKVIIETALLTDEEKVRACVAARRARADFVKTSTGFGGGGATAADVALMSRVVRDARMGVKASGGVRNLADFDSMIAAGATRIGASAGVKIIKEARG